MQLKVLIIQINLLRNTTVGQYSKLNIKIHKNDTVIITT